MSDETEVNEETEFPGESEEVEKVEAPEETQPSEETATEGGPWIVVTLNEIALQENGRIIADQVNDSTFKLQIEADAWIKENAEEGDVYASMRKGRIVRATVVRKLQDL